MVILYGMVDSLFLIYEDKNSTRTRHLHRLSPLETLIVIKIDRQAYILKQIILGSEYVNSLRNLQLNNHNKKWNIF